MHYCCGRTRVYTPFSVVVAYCRDLVLTWLGDATARPPTAAPPPGTIAEPWDTEAAHHIRYRCYLNQSDTVSCEAVCIIIIRSSSCEYDLNNTKHGVPSYFALLLFFQSPRVSRAASVLRPRTLSHYFFAFDAYHNIFGASLSRVVCVLNGSTGIDRHERTNHKQ